MALLAASGVAAARMITASVGVVFLVTAIRGRRPLTLAALQSFVPSRAAVAAQEYATNPHVRRGHRSTSRSG